MGFNFVVNYTLSEVVWFTYLNNLISLQHSKASDADDSQSQEYLHSWIHFFYVERLSMSNKCSQSLTSRWRESNVFLVKFDLWHHEITVFAEGRLSTNKVATFTSVYNTTNSMSSSITGGGEGGGGMYEYEYGEVYRERIDKSMEKRMERE